MPLLHDQKLTSNEEVIYRELIKYWKHKKEKETNETMSILVEIMIQELLAEGGLWQHREEILKRSAGLVFSYQKVVVPNLSNIEAMRLNGQIISKLDEEMIRRRLIYKNRKG